MIYTVEQCINEPVSDAEWSQWSSEMKPVPVLMAVQGFTAAQRFKGINDPGTRKRLLDLGAIVPTRQEQSAEWLGDFVQKEVARWAPILKGSGSDK